MLFYLLLSLVSAQKNAEVCLPLTHQGHVHTQRWAENYSPYSHHYREYDEGDHLYIWVDGNSQKTLAHIYEWDYYSGTDREQDHVMFSLRDYRQKYHWLGHWNYTEQKVTHCKLELMTEPFQPYCLTKSANKRGSGTIGEHVAVDFWEAVYDDGTFHEEIDILVEAGTTNIPVQERVYGQHFNQTEQLMWYWSEHREWFEFSTDKIDPTIFNVPVGCPP